MENGSLYKLVINISHTETVKKSCRTLSFNNPQKIELPD